MANENNDMHLASLGQVSPTSQHGTIRIGVSILMH